MYRHDRQVGQVVDARHVREGGAVPVSDDALEDGGQGRAVQLEAFGCPWHVVADGHTTQVHRDLQDRALGLGQVLGRHRDLGVAEGHRVLLDVTYPDAAARRRVVDRDVGVLLVVLVKHRLKERVDGVGAGAVQRDRFGVT